MSPTWKRLPSTESIQLLLIDSSVQEFEGHICQAWSVSPSCGQCLWRGLCVALKLSSTFEQSATTSSAQSCRERTWLASWMRRSSSSWKLPPQEWRETSSSSSSSDSWLGPTPFDSASSMRSPWWCCSRPSSQEWMLWDGRNSCLTRAQNWQRVRVKSVILTFKSALLIPTVTGRFQIRLFNRPAT